MAARRDKRWSRFASALCVLGALALPECRDPTQITVEVSTDAQCADVRGTTLSVGRLEELENRPVVAQTKDCSPSDGRIGSLVVVPSGDRDAEVSIRVVTGVGKSPEACVNDGYKGGCIVARRTIRYLPHTSLEMPIEMNIDCLDIPCGVTQTCFKGECVSPKIDPEACERGDCRPTAGDGGVPDAEAGSDAGHDAAPDVTDGGTETSLSDASDSGGDADASVSCTAPMAECDGDLSATCETNLETDPKHCGACGHDCLGGTCTAGKCGVVTVWSATGAKPTRIAVDATHVYFVDYNGGNVRRVAKAGGNADLLATGQTAVRVAVDTTHAYWTDNVGKRLMRVPKAGGTSEIVATDVGSAQALELSGNLVYVSDYSSSGGVGWVPKSGGTTTWLVTGTAWPVDFALTPTHVYYASFQNNGKARRVPLSGGTPEDLMDVDNGLVVVANGSDVYLSLLSTGFGKAAIYHLPPGGTPVVMATALKEPVGMAVDATHLYFTDLSEKTVNRLATDGSSGGVVDVLDTNNQTPRGIVVDAEAIYWADENAGAIKMLAK